MKPSLKVSRGVTKLCLSHPFYGSMLLSCGHEPRADVPTMCTDGKKVYWGEDFVDQLEKEDYVRSILAHEVMHIVLSHCEPHPGKDPKLCNISMDHAINITLNEDGFTFPEGVMMDFVFRNMNWQKIYSILEDCKDKADEDDPDYGQGAAGAAGLSEEKQKELGEKTKEQLADPDIMDVLENSDMSQEDKDDIKSKIIQAAEAQKSSGIGRLPGGVEDIIKEIRSNKVNWTDWLMDQMQCNFPDDYTFRRGNRKFLGAYDMYLPTMEGTRIGALAIGMDTSGSVSEDEKIDFLAEINHISEVFMPEKVYLFYCDWDVANYEEFEAGDIIEQLNSKGGGGTSFIPVFDKIDQEDLEIDQLIYFSDMAVNSSCFPAEEPDYPCIFVSTRNAYPVPFGTCITTKGEIA